MHERELTFDAEAFASSLDVAFSLEAFERKIKSGMHKKRIRRRKRRKRKRDIFARFFCHGRAKEKEQWKVDFEPFLQMPKPPPPPLMKKMNICLASMPPVLYNERVEKYELAYPKNIQRRAVFVTEE